MITIDESKFIENYLTNLGYEKRLIEFESIDSLSKLLFHKPNGKTIDIELKNINRYRRNPIYFLKISEYKEYGLFQKPHPKFKYVGISHKNWSHNYGDIMWLDEAYKDITLDIFLLELNNVIKDEIREEKLKQLGI